MYECLLANFTYCPPLHILAYLVLDHLVISLCCVVLDAGPVGTYRSLIPWYPKHITLIHSIPALVRRLPRCCLCTDV